jgi:hypothetical protein
MWELLLTAAIALALVGLGALARLPWETAFALGQGLVLAGLALGVPTGVVYHVALARALGRRGVLPKGWYWQPIALHPSLLPQERPAVLAWCGAGAVGFAITALGLLVLGAPPLLALFQSP